MTRSRKLLIAGIVTIALGAGAVSIAQAVSGDSDAGLTEAQSDRIEHAALAAVHGDSVLSIDAVSQGQVAWKVHVFKRVEPLESWAERTDGRRIVVRLDRDLEWVSAAADAYGPKDELDPR